MDERTDVEHGATLELDAVKIARVVFQDREAAGAGSVAGWHLIRFVFPAPV